jgi:hypothetical protein
MESSRIVQQFITDDEIDRALDYLRDSAPNIAEARRNAILTERMVRHVKALVMKMHTDLPVSAQEREAYASDRYVKACEEEAMAAAEFEKLRSLREAAAAKIEAWRTIGANLRAIKI